MFQSKKLRRLKNYVIALFVACCTVFFLSKNIITMAIALLMAVASFSVFAFLMHRITVLDAEEIVSNRVALSRLKFGPMLSPFEVEMIPEEDIEVIIIEQ